MSTMRLLVASEQSYARTTIASILRQVGCEVTTANGSDETFEQLKHHHFTVLVVDLAAVGAEQLLFLSNLRLLYKRLPILVLLPEPDLYTSFYLAEINLLEVVRKPHVPTELIRALDNLVQTVVCPSRSKRARIPVWMRAQ